MLNWESRKHADPGLIYFTVEHNEKVLTVEAINTPGLDKYDGYVEGVKVISESDWDTVEAYLIQYVSKM